MPIVPRDALSPLAEWQNRILGANLIQWNNNKANSLLSERALLLHHKDPVIFFISTMPGLVASQEIVGDEKGPFVWGLPEDFDSFDERDEENIFHVEYRSLFKEPESDADLDGQIHKLRKTAAWPELDARLDVWLDTVREMGVKV